MNKKLLLIIGLVVVLTLGAVYVAGQQANSGTSQETSEEMMESKDTMTGATGVEEDVMIKEDAMTKPEDKMMDKGTEDKMTATSAPDAMMEK